MNTGIVKSKASGIALMGKVLVGVMVLGAGMMPVNVEATAGDEKFKQFLNELCILGTINPPPGVVWDAATINQMCLDAQTGYVIGAGGAASANLGTTNASSGSSMRKKNGIRLSQNEENEKPAKGASADSGGWGLLVAPQYSSSTRADTDFENGYQAKLRGVVIGLDYRFSDSLVLGLAVGQTKDEASFLNGSGFLKTRNSSFTIYSTWVATEQIGIDGYLGYGKINFDNQRQVRFGIISGTNVGSTTGKQTMAGLSASYQSISGRVNLAPFINFDYIKTSINGYNELGSNSGANSLALHYGDRSVISMTSSIGGRMSTSYNYDWGALVPTARLAAIHEFQNKTRQINNELVITPGASFIVETDNPDRNFLNLGLGVSAALNSGTQLFLDYEKRTQDRLLSSWAVGLGGLFEF